MVDDEYWMHHALAQAHQAGQCGEIPVGAVLVINNKNIAAAGNRSIQYCDPSAHAEILTLRQAAQTVQNYRISQATLYVTLEPCLMCMGAMIHARIERLVFGASDPKTGAVHSLYQIGDDPRLNHRIICRGGVLHEECSDILKKFFQEKRKQSKFPPPSDLDQF